MLKSVVLLVFAIVLYCYALVISIGQKSFVHDPRALIQLHLQAVSYRSWETVKMQLTPVFRMSGVDSFDKAVWEPSEAEDAIQFYGNLLGQLTGSTVDITASPFTPEKVAVIIKSKNGSTIRLHYHLNTYGQIDHLEVDGPELVSRLRP